MGLGLNIEADLLKVGTIVTNWCMARRNVNTSVIIKERNSLFWKLGMSAWLL